MHSWQPATDIRAYPFQVERSDQPFFVAKCISSGGSTLGEV